MTRVANIFVAEPVRDHHRHAGRQSTKCIGLVANVALPCQGLKQLIERRCFDFQDVFEVGFQMPVFGQQVIQVAVQKPVIPNELKQGMQKEPCIFDIFHVLARV